jgi:hypothetical protein
VPNPPWLRPKASSGYLRWSTPFLQPRCVLASANHGAVDVMESPVKLALGVGLLLEISQGAVPDPSTPPPIEARRHHLPGAVLLGQVAPVRFNHSRPLTI